MSRIWPAASLVVLSALPARAECPLELRSYEDLDERDFVLEFDPPAADQGASQVAVARILHPQRGELARFDVVAPSGYGGVYLVSGERDHAAYFFTESLRSSRTAEGSSLLFVEGMGLADWQDGELPDSRDHPLGDVIWKLVGCKE